MKNLSLPVILFGLGICWLSDVFHVDGTLSKKDKKDKKNEKELVSCFIFNASWVEILTNIHSINVSK